MASIGSFGLDVGIYGPLADPATIMTLARHAEDTGFESIWLADHVAFPVTFKSEYPYSAKGDFPLKLDNPLLEPVATMGVPIFTRLVAPTSTPIVATGSSSGLSSFRGKSPLAL